MKQNSVSFFNLLDKSIVIPSYQRDYAQGREDSNTTIIRKDFVNLLVDSVCNDKPVVLDFVYGGNEGASNAFTPVDGQQRLTTLFLLHWYVFVRANDKKAMRKLARFTYSTRTSSEEFCKNVLTVNRDDLICDDDSISAQLKEMSWFNGMMNSDSTVKSILVMINSIHNRFRKEDNCDFEKYAEQLQSDASITLVCIDMEDSLGGEDAIRDLYIKMNARGVALTDFEIFKAQLQKTVGENEDKIDLLRLYKDDITPEDRVRIIGDFNNQYTNLFFNVIDKGELNAKNKIDSSNEQHPFDIAMMNFINEIIRTNFNAKLSELQVSQKAYRDNNTRIKNLTGKEFCYFVESCGKDYYKKENRNAGRNEYVVDEEGFNNNKANIKKSFEKSIKEILDILDKMSARNSNNENDVYDLLINNEQEYEHKMYNNDLFESLKTTDDSATKALARMALNEYIYRFGYPDNNSQNSKDAYIYWSRLVWRLTRDEKPRNVLFKNYDEQCETFRGLVIILDDIDVNDISEATLIKEISQINIDNNKYIIGNPAIEQMKEEIEKATLINNNNDFNSLIKEAEDYFSNGQIGTVLRLSDSDINSFKKSFGLLKDLFEPNGELKLYSKDSEQKYLFERALLSSYKLDNDETHMESMNAQAKATMKFYMLDIGKLLSHQVEGYQRELLINFLNEIIEKKASQKSINKILKTYLKEKTKTNDDWRYLFLKYPLIGSEISGASFVNGGFEVVGDYVLLYTTGTRRSQSAELHSYALAWLLEKNSNESNKIILKYHTSDEDINVKPEERYFQIGSKEIYYNNGFFRDKNDEQWKKTFDDAFKELKK